jgi:hypothetical protein
MPTERLLLSLAGALGVLTSCVVVSERADAAESDAPAATDDGAAEDDAGAEVRSPRTVTLGLEASLVGLSFGPRAEFLWRMGEPGTVSHLRVHLGVLDGPEFVFVPMGVGYRAVFREDLTVQPFVGLGYEAHFFLTDGPVYSQLASVNFEGGCGFAINELFSAGLGTSLDWTVVGERGPGLQLRMFGGYRF